MLKREDIIAGMYLVTIQDNVFRSKNNLQNFPAGSIFKVKKLTSDITNPDLYLLDDKNNVWLEGNFKRILSIVNKHADANDDDKVSHNNQKNDAAILKQIKQLAQNDDLKPIIQLLEENPQFLNTLKNVKVLMAYAIKSKTTTVLTHGFENEWFKSIDWNENIITVDYSGFTPLGYAVKKSSQEVQQLLMFNSASVDNKIKASYNTSIADSLAIPHDEKTKFLQLGKTTEIIKLHNKFNTILPEKNTTSKKVKL